MTWLNPWAWAGLLTLAVPVLVHLLARRRARVQRFPTLRFLEATAPVATRRARLADPLLLAVRLLILIAAVAALAQPLLLTADRRAAAARTVARAVVVDTSFSMQRAAAGGAGERALDAARREAAAAGEGASVATIIETATPAAALAGAAAWLGGRPGRHEITVISDFQQGTIDSVDVAGVPAGIGLELRRVEVAVAEPDAWRVRHGGTETTTRLALDGARTDVEWSWRGAAGGARGASDVGGAPLQLLHSPAQAAGAAAAEQVGLTAAAVAPDPTRPVVIAFAGYEGLERLAGEARGMAAPWVADAAVKLLRDADLEAAARTALAAGSAAAKAPFLVIARDEAGEPVVLAAQTELDGAERLLLVVRAEAGTLLSAAAVAAAARATAAELPVAERETGLVAPAELAAWGRAAGPAASLRASGTGGSGGSPHGRWVWLLVLALLGVETWLRRRARPAVEASGAQPG